MLVKVICLTKRFIDYSHQLTKIKLTFGKNRRAFIYVKAFCLMKVVIKCSKQIDTNYR